MESDNTVSAVKKETASNGNGHTETGDLTDQSTNQSAQTSTAAATQAHTQMHSAEPSPQELLEQEKNRYLYLYAEFENYKKRAIKERSDLAKFGYEGFAREMLLVMDNFERALQHTDNLDALVSGLKMVSGEMGKILERFGISAVKTVGEKFDPNLHEAVGQEEGDDGVITKEFLKGYSLHGRLLRPAKVVVGVAKK
jgi:molecular chaperone GrpE